MIGFVAMQLTDGVSLSGGGGRLRDIANQIVNGISLPLHALAARMVHRLVIVRAAGDEQGDRKEGEELSGLHEDVIVCHEWARLGTGDSLRMAQTKQQIQSLLDAAGTKPRHRFGQNFMIDQNLVRIVADAGMIVPGDAVIEVGPGTGTLTEEILSRAAHG